MMGCDIHVVVEVLGYDGVWHICEAMEATQTSIGAIIKPVKLKDNHLTPQGRHYALFTELANVRSRGGVVGPSPKGLPADASPESVVFFDDPDWHSVSWVTLQEAREALTRLGTNPAWAYEGKPAYDLEWEAFVEKCAGLRNDEDEVRILFAFDN